MEPSPPVPDETPFDVPPDPSPGGASPGSPSPAGAAPVPPRRSGGLAIVLAWLGIGLLVALQLAMRPSADAALGDEAGDAIGNVLMRIQGRYLVGAGESTGTPEMLYAASEQFNIGSVDQRQRYVVLAAELGGPLEGASRIADLDGLIATETEETAYGAAPFELRAEQAAVQRILGELYGAAAEGDEEGAEARLVSAIEALSEDDRTALRDELGWFGELALAPRGVDPDRREDAVGPARRVFVTIISMAFAGAGIAVLGFGGLIALVVLMLLGRLRGGLANAQPAHGVYAETFAIWLVVFLALQIGAGVVPMLVPGVGPTGSLVVVFVAFFLSLVTLAWPVARGIPWARVREDIGWTLGRQPLVEPLLGLAGYAMALPILAVGVLLTLLLMLIDQQITGAPGTFDSAAGPAHPIVLDVAAGNVGTLIVVLALASIAAPVVEETMFRGVLYRHLRDATRGGGPAVSIIVSGLVNAFVFAVIHPQGVVAVPALMSLAIAFGLIREWRGTVLPAVIMHGISNGIVMVMLALVAV